MEHQPKSYVQSLFEVAKDNNTVYHYIKCQGVSARKAVEGEKISTIINEEEETVNTANEGDIVVKSKTKNKEQYIIAGDIFRKRYKLSEGATEDEDGFKAYDPIGETNAFIYNGESFTFDAPWGEKMLVHDGDFIASPELEDLEDIYRVEQSSFLGIYRIDCHI